MGNPASKEEVQIPEKLEEIEKDIEQFNKISKFIFIVY